MMALILFDYHRGSEAVVALGSGKAMEACNLHPYVDVAFH
jgi:hypothetical protein